VIVAASRFAFFRLAGKQLSLSSISGAILWVASETRLIAQRLHPMKKSTLDEAVAVVLVVEDEPLIRIFTVQVLAEAGFEVEEAGNADEALKRLKDRPVKALVTDIDMPGRINGCALAWEVHTLHPTAALLVISGVETPSANELPPTVRFLRKPVAPEKLVTELNHALSSA
jgi:DNA-binding NtrC family response regulator